MRNKKPSYSVGRIKDGKLTGTSGQVFWSLDASMAIIVRDLLYAYADFYDREDILGCPVGAEEEGEVIEYDKLSKEEFFSLRRRGQEIVRGIADKFDSYAQEGYSEETAEALKEGLGLLGKYLPHMWLP